MKNTPNPEPLMAVELTMLMQLLRRLENAGTLPSINDDQIADLGLGAQGSLWDVSLRGWQRIYDKLNHQYEVTLSGLQRGQGLMNLEASAIYLGHLLACEGHVGKRTVRLWLERARPEPIAYRSTLETLEMLSLMGFEDLEIDAAYRKDPPKDLVGKEIMEVGEWRHPGPA